MTRHKFTLCLIASLLFVTSNAQQRATINLKNWKFTKGDIDNAQFVGFNDANWESVQVPHDWAIYGPFDKEVDKQTVAIVQKQTTLLTSFNDPKGHYLYCAMCFMNE